MKKVSVIIPVYNAEKYLDACLDSVINQGYKNLEIILVNDGSKDSSKEICMRYLEDKRVIYLEQENGGVSKARNFGLSVASGDYISFLDSDDMLVKGAIGYLIDIMEKFNPDILKYNQYVLDGEKYSVNKNVRKEDCFAYGNQYRSFIEKNIFVSPEFSNITAGLYKKEAIENLTFDEKIKYGEDFLFVSKLLKNNKSLYVSSKCNYYYRIFNMSATNSLDIDKLLKQLEDINTVIELIYEDYGNGEGKSCALNRYISDKNNCYKKIIKSVGYKAYLKIKNEDNRRNKSLKLYSDSKNAERIEKKLKTKNRISFYVWKAIYKNEKIIKKILRR